MKLNYEILFVNKILSPHASENYIKKYYEKIGYIVLKGNIKGYRGICTKNYWKEYSDKIDKKQIWLINYLLRKYGKKEFDNLSKTILNKKGCPDLMLIKRGISFIEVKSGKDHLLPEQIKFMLNCKYPCKVIHLIKW